MTSSTRVMLRTLSVTTLLLIAARADAAFIGNLDGVSTSSTFEIGGEANLPTLGWSNVVASARAWDNNVNGMLIAASGNPYTDYAVEYNTGVAILPNTQYTLTLGMGYAAALTGGNSGYAFTLGTTNGGIFTALAPPAIGNVPFAGDSTTGGTAYSDSQIYTSGAIVTGDILALRWSQTSTLGTPFSDFFGIDNVTLDALAVSPALLVPEPAALGLIALGMLGLLARRGRRLAHRATA